MVKSTAVDTAREHIAMFFQQCPKYFRAIIGLVFVFDGSSQPNGAYEASKFVIL